MRLSAKISTPRRGAGCVPSWTSGQTVTVVRLRSWHRLAAGSGLRIIAATGFWKEIVYPDYFDDSSVGEITEGSSPILPSGIGGTAVRAGIIGELGTEATGLTPRTEKRSGPAPAPKAGRRRAYHAPAEGIAALDQLHLLLSCGVDPGRVMIGHIDCMDDIEMHGAIAEAGAFVGYDRVGSLRYQADEVRIRLITEMISRGYEKNIILSCDLATRSRMRCRGELGYSYLLENFIPRLRDAGVTESTLQQILTDNPRRLLTGVPG